jgi:hypothetical protein
MCEWIERAKDRNVRNDKQMDRERERRFVGKMETRARFEVTG